MRKDLGLLLLRVAFGSLLLLSHGWGKLVGFSTIAPTFADPFGLGGNISLALVVFAEVVCSLCVIAGFFTRWVVWPPVVAMSVAFFSVHAADPFARKELALVYLCAFLAIFLTGPGRLSADSLRKDAI